MKLITRIVVTLGILLLGLAEGAQAQMVVVVNPKNTAPTLTAEQVAAIYLGKSNNFPTGGTAAPADQAEAADIRNNFYTKVSGKSAAQVKAAWSRLVFSGKGTPPKELTSSAEVKKYVAANPDAIGYIEKSAVDNTVKVVLTVE